MNTLLRRWRLLNCIQRVIGVLRLCVLFRAALTVLYTALVIWKRKER